MKSILSTLKSDGLRLKLRKYVFLQPEVTYIGFRINKDGVLLLPEKIEIIKNAQVLKNMTELKSFLGFINYYHRHLHNFSSFLELSHYIFRTHGNGPEKKIISLTKQRSYFKLGKFTCAL